MTHRTSNGDLARLGPQSFSSVIRASKVLFRYMAGEFHDGYSPTILLACLGAPFLNDF